MNPGGINDCSAIRDAGAYECTAGTCDNARPLVCSQDAQDASAPYPNSTYAAAGKGNDPAENGSLFLKVLGWGFEKSIQGLNVLLRAEISCGGKVDECQKLKEASCDQGSAAGVPIDANGIPASKYEYDLAADARDGLIDASQYNSCITTGLSVVLFDESSPNKGDYTVETQRITLNPALMDHGTLKGSEHEFAMRYRLFHELGHHINHYVILNFCPDGGFGAPFADISWNTADGSMLQGMNPSTENGDFLNADAVKNSDEDFAVCFGYFVWMPGEFRRRAQTSPVLQKKYEYFRDKIFQGHEFNRPWDDVHTNSAKIPWDGKVSDGGMQLKLTTPIRQLLPLLTLTRGDDPAHSCRIHRD